MSTQDTGPRQTVQKNTNTIQHRKLKKMSNTDIFYIRK